MERNRTAARAGRTHGARAWRAALTAALAACPAHAGPFANETNGIPASSTVFRAWASGVLAYEPGGSGSGGFAQDDAGQPCAPANAVAGKPAGFSLNDATRHVLSLGNGGRVVLPLPHPLRDEPGPDFAVFENGFADATAWDEGSSREGSTSTYAFAELAFVEVGTTTGDWARFPATCLNTAVVYNLNDRTLDRYASQDVTLVDGLAGKHVIDVGTPFDLAVLAGHPAVTSGAVNLAAVHFIRLIDAVGDGRATDVAGRPVLDPFYDVGLGYPAPAPAALTDGFDLRAVGLIHLGGVNIARGADGGQAWWYGLAGWRYQLQSSPDLEAWANAGSEHAGSNRVCSAAPPPGARFLRLVRRLP